MMYQAWTFFFSGDGGVHAGAFLKGLLNKTSLDQRFWVQRKEKKSALNLLID